MSKRSEDFAWDSPGRALKFAKALSEVMIRHRPVDIDEIEEQLDETERLRSVLRVLLSFTPVEAASLWKVKARAGRASCIADTRSERGKSARIEDDAATTFVCELNRPPVAEALRRYSEQICPNGKQDWLVVPSGEQRLFIPFGRLCGPAGTGDKLPNYLVELYAPAAPTDDRGVWGMPDDVIEAMKSKLTSGICALIDRRLTRITREISNVTLSDAALGADDAINNAMKIALPRFIRCQRIIRLNQLPSGDYRIAQDHSLLPDEGGTAVQPSSLSEEARQQLASLIDHTFAQQKAGIRSTTALVFESEIKNCLTDPCFSRFRNMMAARLVSNIEGSSSIDYFILVNRMNDLSAESDQNSQVEDFFDWEDEVYLAHIALMAGFIREVFSSEEVRIRRAHILAHEMHAPTGFIYATVERILDSFDGRWSMSEAMIKRELRDILLTSDLQSALIDNLMLGLEVVNQPPEQKYQPESVSLRDVADNIARMVLPICRKYKVNPAGITMRHLPTLMFDRRAITQVFLNLTTNAIKYSKGELKLNVFSEHILVKELEATNAPTSLIERLRAMNITEGHFVTFRDHGIGVPAGFRGRMFRPGNRANHPDVLSKTGAGLGLSVVRTILREHFGEVWLERAGNPTEIVLFLPSILETGAYQNLEAWRGGF